MIKSNTSKNKDSSFVENSSHTNKKNFLSQIFDKWKSSLPKSKTTNPVKKYKVSQKENETLDRENTWKQLKRGISLNKIEEKKASKSLKTRVRIAAK